MRARPARALAAGLAVGLLALLAVVPAAGQDVGAQLERIRDAVSEARQTELRLVAPRHLERATEAVREAVARRDRGAPAQRVLEALSRARRALDEARRLRKAAERLLSPALRAREAAVAAGAPEEAPEAWAEAEETLRDAGRALEAGDDGEARERASAAADRYGRAERLGVERRVLGLARRARAGARELAAPERAPRTWRRADSLLARAESALGAALGPEGEDRALVRARELADSADRAFRRASRIAAQADTARSAGGGVERLVLRYERALGRVADSLRVTGVGPGDPDRMADSALAAVARRAADRSTLRRRLDSIRALGRAERRRADSLAAALARASRRLDTLSRRLERRRSREARLREIRALFAEGETRVLTSGDSLMLRLVGMSFPPGETEVPADAHPLLVKVQAAIEKFPGAGVVIEGHTDSRGDESRNRTLSRRRAIAVREWLLSRMPLSADRITATGYGESRPIAPNETEEGRAKNRRIDVILRLPDR